MSIKIQGRVGKGLQRGQGRINGGGGYREKEKEEGGERKEGQG